jgi:hypothetical protein
MEGYRTATTGGSSATSRLILAAASVLGSWVSASACAGGSGSGAADGVGDAARSKLVGDEGEPEPCYLDFFFRVLRLTHVVALHMVLCLGMHRLFPNLNLCGCICSRLNAPPPLRRVRAAASAGRRMGDGAQACDTRPALFPTPWSGGPCLSSCGEGCTSSTRDAEWTGRTSSSPKPAAWIQSMSRRTFPERD